jgi:hypothetical protein
VGDPGGYIESVHNAGGIVMHTVGSAEEARRARVGYRRDTAAGARCVDAVAPVPLIAACEIGAARGVAPLLALAAWLGMRFLLAEQMQPTVSGGNRCRAKLRPVTRDRGARIVVGWALKPAGLPMGEQARDCDAVVSGLC